MAALSSLRPVTNSLWQRLFIVPAGLSRGEERAHMAIAAVIPPALIIHTFYIFLFAFWGVYPLALFNILSVIIWGSAIFLLRQRHLTVATAICIPEVLIHSSLVIIYIGWSFGAQYLILGPFMVVVTNTWLKRWVTIGLGLLHIAVFIGWYYYTESFPPLAAAPQLQLAAMNVLNITFAFLLVGGFLMYLVSEAEQANQANEELLNNVLPQPIAERLKEEPSTIADRFQSASILFADLADFAPMAQNLAPDELVELLDAVFSRFDELVDQYGLEKIKTIGDAYMVASGIPIPRDDHAEALAEFALAICDSLAAYNEANGLDLQMRIGLNSGPVVAGVIGKRRLLYDLWGDSVNTASRMESHGIPGEIQVSEATHILLEDAFTFVDRGIIHVKGKGPMHTYFLQR